MTVPSLRTSITTAEQVLPSQRRYHARCRVNADRRGCGGMTALRPEPADFLPPRYGTVLHTYVGRGCSPAVTHFPVLEYDTRGEMYCAFKLKGSYYRVLSASVLESTE